MATNRGVAYLGPGEVDVQSIDFPKHTGKNYFPFLDGRNV